MYDRKTILVSSPVEYGGIFWTAANPLPLSCSTLFALTENEGKSCVIKITYLLAPLESYLEPKSLFQHKFSSKMDVSLKCSTETTITSDFLSLTEHNNIAYPTLPLS